MQKEIMTRSPVVTVSMSYCARAAIIAGLAALADHREKGGRVNWERYSSAGDRDNPPVVITVRAADWFWSALADEGERTGAPTLRAAFRAALAYGLDIA